MKKTIKLALGASLLLGATSVLATNGDHMMALGAKSSGMGGVGVATAFGAESALANPALVRGNEVSFGGTYFMPDVSFKGEVTAPMANGAAYQKSDADKSMIPSVGFVYDVSKEFTWGLGMYGTAGMGVDYRDDTAVYSTGPATMPSPTNPQNGYAGTMNGTNQLATALQIMKFTLPMAYRPMDNLSLGFAPVIQYGSLGMSYNNGAYTMTADRNATYHLQGTFTANNVRTGAGVSDDLGFGYEIGIGYEIAGISIGAVYKSAISMTYENQISEATANFGLSGYGDELEQPSEIGLGVSYTMGENTIAVDYKQIGWSSAAGYDDFKWDDQQVIALGYEYKTKSWALRVGYNHANNPIKEQNGAAGTFAGGDLAANYEGAVLNYFNLAGFPAIIENHYTIGGTINIGEATSIDLAYVYSPEVTASYDTSAMTQGQMIAGGYDLYDATEGGMVDGARSTANVKHSQSAFTIAANIAF